MKFGDVRLDERGAEVGQRLMARPGESLPKVFEDPSQLEGTYRFLGNPAVTPKAILAPHVDASVARGREWTGTLLAVHDTTEMSFGGAFEREGLGTLANGGQGFLAHLSLLTALHVGGDLRDPLGILNIETIFRDAPKGKRSGHELARAEDRESDRWLKAYEAVAALGLNVIHVCDREADSYRQLAMLQDNQQRFVFRSKHDRKTATEDGVELLRFALAQQNEIRLKRTVTLLARHPGEEAKASKSGKAVLKKAAFKRTLGAKTTHPSRDERTAKLVVTAGCFTLMRPRSELGKYPEQLQVNVVRVVEPKPPTGYEAIEWILLTSEPIKTRSDIEHIIDVYRARWIIEEFNRALKQGCGFKKLQLEKRASIVNALALYSSVAWRLLRMRTLARWPDDRPAADVLTNAQLAVLRMVCNKPLSPTPTVRDVLWAIATKGGHLKNNGEPGWLTIGRGYHDLLLLEQGWLAAKGQRSDQS